MRSPWLARPSRVLPMVSDPVVSSILTESKTQDSLSLQRMRSSGKFLLIVSSTASKALSLIPIFLTWSPFASSTISGAAGNGPISFPPIPSVRQKFGFRCTRSFGGAPFSGNSSFAGAPFSDDPGNSSQTNFFSWLLCGTLDVSTSSFCSGHCSDVNSMWKLKFLLLNSIVLSISSGESNSLILLSAAFSTLAASPLISCSAMFCRLTPSSRSSILISTSGISRSLGFTCMASDLKSSVSS